MKRKISMALAVITALSCLSGCSLADKEVDRINSMSPQPFRSMQEVMDTNAEGMKYSSFSQRTAIADYKADYNMVSEEQKKKCYDMLVQILKNHNLNTGYDMSLVSKEQHDYWKSTMDDLVLDNPTAQAIKEFSGYYFLTVHFDTKTNTQGAFLGASNYLGLDNCFNYDANGDPQLNTIWISQAFQQLNNTRSISGEQPYQIFLTDNSGTVYNRIEETQPEVPVEETVADTGVVDTENTEANVDGTDTEGETTENVRETEETIEAEVTQNDTEDVYTPANKAIGDSDIYNKNIRKLEYDLEEYENMFGSSQTNIAFMPNLSQVYQSVTPTGALSGDGCYNEGISGLTDFGFNREANGEAYVTFVFKQNELDKNQMDYVLAYLENYKSLNEFRKDSSTDFITVPDFVNEQINIKVDELDRLTNNGDINGLMRMDTIEDAGLALKLANYNKSADITCYATDVKGVLERKGNVYLVEFERTVADTPKNNGYVAQYKETGYMVVRQKDLEFYINDIFTATRELTKQPQIYEVSEQYRQLVNLNLADEVSEEVQKEITSTVLNDWAYYSNIRELSNPKLESYGMYGQFNKTKSVLSDEKLEYINSKMRNYLVYKGAKEKSVLNIVPMDWIGGTGEQVEFTTKEFINFPNFKEGIYIRCYYLVSHFGTRWVIDDIQVIEERHVSGADYDTFLDTFNSSGEVIKGEKASSEGVTEVDTKGTEETTSKQ